MRGGVVKVKSGPVEVKMALSSSIVLRRSTISLLHAFEAGNMVRLALDYEDLRVVL